MIYLVAKNIGLFAGAAVVAMDVVDSLKRSGLHIEPVCVDYKVPKEGYDGLSSLKRRKMAYLPEKKNYPETITGRVRYLLKRTQEAVDRMILDFHLNRQPPDIMIFNDYMPSTMELINRYRSRCKTMHIVHVSPYYVDQFEDFIAFEELLEIYKNSDHLVFVSDECRKKWLEHGELDKKKTSYIPNCAKEEEAHSCLNRSKDEVRKTLELNPDSFYLVNVGSIKSRKGQDLLIEAAPELKKIAPHLEILIVGSIGGKYVSKLREVAEQKGLDFVRFTGRKSNAMEYIYASDLFILPSRAEALPLVLLEAMILKTPMIGSNIDGVPEMIEHEKTGLLFESENVDELVRRFKEMYNGKEKRQRYAEQASEKYWNDFSKEQFTKRYMNLVEGAMNK